MSSYSTYWRTTILASMAFHFLSALGFSYLLPHFLPEPIIENVVEIEWVDVELSPDNVTVLEAEAIPSEIVQVQEMQSLFNAQDLVIPELPEPKTFVEPPPSIEIKTPLQTVKPVEEAAKKIEQSTVEQNTVEQSITVPANSKQQFSKPPVTLTEVYPESGSGLGYKGYVAIAATIGKDGKVKATKIMFTSGRMFVDEIARKAVAQWTFKPALDRDGKPMECDKIITFDFKKIA